MKSINKKTSILSKTFDILNTVFLFLLAIACLFPFLYTLSMSMSDELAIQKNEVTFFPIGLQIDVYKAIFRNDTLWSGYLNSIVLTIAGVVVCVFLTFLTAYALTRKNLPYKNFILIFFTITMFFGGGLIPTFLIVKNAGLYNSIWALIIPGAIEFFHVILVRTFIKQNIHESLEEAAFIDGASELKILFNVIMPLSIPIIAVISLYRGIGFWNDWFGPMIYIKDVEKYPLPLILRRILLQDIFSFDNSSSGYVEGVRKTPQSFKSGVIILSIIPVIAAYPFVQKHFVKGVLIGSIKG